MSATDPRNPDRGPHSTPAARAIVTGTWACAGIVMATSAGNAVLTFGALGGNRAIGLGLGVAVDVALCAGLIGDRRLCAHGLTSSWGRVLRITAAVMSVVLNTGASLIAGHYFLALLHAFLPILLVVLTEYGQDVLLKFTALRRDVNDTGPPVDIAVEQALAVARQEHDRAMTSLQQQLTAERDNHAMTTRTLRENTAAVEELRRDIERDKSRNTRRRTSRTTAGDRRAWVRQARNEGSTVTGADVHRQFPNAPRDGARIVRQVEAELDAELQAVATGGT